MKSKWKSAAAECIGPLHVRQNLPMQDAHTVWLGPHAFIAAVSDGLGSKKNSAVGSRIACRVFIRCARKWIRRRNAPPEKLAETLVNFWLTEVTAAGYEPESCGCTFLGAVCRKETLYLFRLGDGMITALFCDARNPVLVCDDKDDSFSNQTACLTWHSRVENFEILKFPAQNLQSVFLCTDGISDDISKGAEIAFVQDLQNQYRNEGVRKMQRDMRHWISHWPVPKHSDDKTAVFVSRRYGAHE